MMPEQTIQSKSKVKVYNDKEYSVTLATSWKIEKVSEYQTFFFGPKVGKVRIGFYITSISKNGKSYLDAAKKMKNTQMLEKEYTLLEEKDISGERHKAFMRRSCWYNEEIKMNIFVRDVFTEFDGKIHILSCSIPNSSSMVEIDRIAVAMMNSFQLNTELYQSEKVKSES